MTDTLRKLCAPILTPFESGDEPYVYKESHRTILIAVGALFLLLATGSIAAGIAFAQLGALLPSLIFLGVGLCCLVVGTLGSDRAVSKIWGSK